MTVGAPTKSPFRLWPIGAFFCIATAPSWSAADVIYSLNDLGSVQPSSINNSGQVAGTFVATDGLDHAFLQSPGGSLQDLGTPGQLSVATSINNDGTISGSAGSYGAEHAYIWNTSGSTQDLGTFGGSYTAGSFINNNGDVAANVWYGHYNVIAVPKNGASSNIGTLGGFWTVASGINDSGAITGYSQIIPGFGTQHAFLYSGSGPMADLGTLGGSDSTGNAINNSGSVVGWSITASGTTHAFLYSGSGPMQDLGTLPGTTSSVANAINGSAQVVGEAGNKAFIWNANTGMSDLNSQLNVSAQGWSLTNANAINDAGLIAGTGINAAGQTHAFLLTPSSLVQQAVARTPNAGLINVPVPAASQLETYDAATGQFVQGGSVNPSLPTVVLTPGFADSPASWATSLAKQYPGAGQTVNLVAWNWQSEAGSLNDPSSLGLATSLTLGQGAGLGTALVTALGNNYNQSIHFIGHSLGTLVNAEAVNVFNTHTNDSAHTQVTLFDDAEIADDLDLSANPLFTPIPSSNNYATLDNYISAFGNLHVATNIANVILTQGGAAPGSIPTPNDLIAFHLYPTNWYPATIPASSGATVGYAWDTNNPAATTFPKGQYFLQSSAPGNPLSFQPIGALQAAAAIANRDITESPAVATAATYFVGGTIVNSAIQTVGNVTNTLTAEASTDVTGPGYALKLVLGGADVTPDSAVKSLAISTNDVTSPNPSYAWVPVSIPAGTQTLSFKFSSSNVGPGDDLVVGIADTQLFALDTSSVPDSTLENSGLLDVSQFAGQNEELFVGFSGVSSDGSATIQDLQFQVAPEPSPGVFVAASLLSVLLRPRRRRRPVARLFR
jgi:probable HAF family extracellular repeat protein